MNREQAKDMLPIIQALVEGKRIQLNDRIGHWIDVDFINVELCNPSLYRIKSEPKYRPFENKEECWQEMLKHQPFGWIKASHGYFNIIGIMNDKINFGTNNNWLDYEYMFNMYKFIDGTAFGIKEE